MVQKYRSIPRVEWRPAENRSKSKVMAHSTKQTRSDPSDERDSANTDKIITLIRHAQSLANEYTHSWSNILTGRFLLDPGMIDPVLSAKGVAQAEVVSKKLSSETYLQSERIELIVVSPLRRALQTALILFPPTTHSVPMVVCQFQSEIGDTSGDVGSSPSILSRDFPEFVFDKLSEEWWATDGSALPHKESTSSVRRRIAEFERFLMERPENRIVVVGHSAFFRRWTHHRKLQNVGFDEVVLSSSRGLKST